MCGIKEKEAMPTKIVPILEYIDSRRAMFHRVRVNLLERSTGTISAPVDMMFFQGSDKLNKIAVGSENGDGAFVFKNLFDFMDQFYFAILLSHRQQFHNGAAVDARCVRAGEC